MVNYQIIDFSSDDAFARLARLNMQAGLANLSLALEREGLSPQVSAIFWPEFSITRNRDRWAEGFAYGALIVWQPTDIPFVPLSVRPNGCGVLLAAVPEMSREEIFSLISSFQQSDFFSDPNVVLRPGDLSHSNHFLLFGKAAAFAGLTLIVAHTCPSVLKEPSASYSGLYLGTDSPLLRLSKKLEHNGVPFHYLVGQAAQDYLETFARAEDICLSARVSLVERIVKKDISVLLNDTHQGIRSHYVMLGCSEVKEYGLILGNDSDTSCRLIAGVPPLGQVLRVQQKKARVKEAEQLRICPHGLGITAADSRNLALNTDRLSPNLITFSANQRDYVFSHTEDIPRSYRSADVMERTTKLMQAQEAFNIEPVVTCKL